MNESLPHNVISENPDTIQIDHEWPGPPANISQPDSGTPDYAEFPPVNESLGWLQHVDFESLERQQVSEAIAEEPTMQVYRPLPKDQFNVTSRVRSNLKIV